MKNFIMRLIVKLFGLNYVKYFVKFEQSDEEQTKEAMEYLIASGKHYRVLPDSYKDFYKEFITGSKDDKAWRAQLYRIALDTLTKEESYMFSAHALVAPYATGDKWPEQLFHQVVRRVASKVSTPVPMLGYVKIIAETLIEEIPEMPIDVARAIAYNVYHTNRYFKGL